MSHRCSGKAWLGPRSQLKPSETPELCGAPCLSSCLTWFHAFSKCKIRNPPPEVCLRLHAQHWLGPQFTWINRALFHYRKLRPHRRIKGQIEKGKKCQVKLSDDCLQLALFSVIITHHLLLVESILSNRPCVFPHTCLSPHLVKLCN